MLCFIFPAKAIWEIPANTPQKKNPTEITPKNVAVGKNIFTRTCQACHGPKADGKGLIASTSLVTDTFQRQTDGVIYYKVTTGKDKMPPFGTMLKEDETWSVINYLRVLVNPKAVPPAKDVSLEVSSDESKKFKTITAFVYEKKDSIKTPQNEVDVHFYIKRDFGLMRFGELINYTKANGKVTVRFPEKIIGDKDGNTKIIVKVENNMMYNDVADTIETKWGFPIVTEDAAFEERSLWGSRDKSPIWLLLLANGIIIIVWGFIFYVIYNIFRIKKSSKVFIK